MTRETIAITTVAFLCIAAASSPPVTFESPCEYSDNHGKHRWSVKNDPMLSPADANAIQVGRGYNAQIFFELSTEPLAI
jgi:hypothetical protein